jgi:hypothetical protein
MLTTDPRPARTLGAQPKFAQHALILDLVADCRQKALLHAGLAVVLSLHPALQVR